MAKLLALLVSTNLLLSVLTFLMVVFIEPAEMGAKNPAAPEPSPRASAPTAISRQIGELERKIDRMSSDLRSFRSQLSGLERQLRASATAQAATAGRREIGPPPPASMGEREFDYSRVVPAGDAGETGSGEPDEAAGEGTEIETSEEGAPAGGEEPPGPEEAAGSEEGEAGEGEGGTP